MLSPKQIKSKLENVIDQAHESRRFFVNPDSNFTRKGKCEFKKLISAMLVMEGGTLRDVIQRFFGTDAKSTPTVSALVQARKKLTDDLFPSLFSDFNRLTPFLKTQDGMHWLLGDGTDLNLPTNRKDTVYLVKSKGKTCGYWQMHLNSLYHMGEGRFLDVFIQPRPGFNEPAALCTMVDRCPLGNNTVFVADRGYPSWNLLAHIQQKGMFFLFRSKTPSSPGCLLKNLSLPGSGEYDVDISLGLTRSHKKKYRKNPGQYRVICRHSAFDFIPQDDMETVFNLSFRVVCVQLPTGDFEYLITNLPKDRFSPSKLKKYYFGRWKIETAFRQLKYICSMVCFHSANPAFIRQEIYARLILYNCSSLIAAWGNKNKKPRKKWEYILSFSNAVSVTRVSLQTNITNKTILQLLCRYQVPIKTGRKAERRIRSQRAIPLNYRP